MANTFEFYEKINAKSVDEILDFLESRFKKYGNISMQRAEDGAIFKGYRSIMSPYFYKGSVAINKKDSQFSVELTGKLGVGIFGWIGILVDLVFVIGALSNLALLIPCGVVSMIFFFTFKLERKNSIKVLDLIMGDLKKAF